jgi:peptidoglycan/LPS O-acetylase OafA/YrhL
VASRDVAFDFVKGSLVLIMIVYHSLNIVASATFEEIRYIRFISGSFIFVSGYMLSRFIGPTFRSNPAAVSRRLFVRGVKLVLIVVTLNLLIQASGIGNASKMQQWREAGARVLNEFFLHGDNRIASFVILLPIGYLFIASPAAFLATGDRRGVAAVLLVTTLLLAASADLAGWSSNVDFLLVGLCGLLAGMVFRFDSFVSAPTLGGHALSAVGLATSLWITGRFGGFLPAYIAGVAMILKFLHELSPSGDVSASPFRWVALLGRYSLPAYILQILLIQIVSRPLARTLWPRDLRLAFCFIVVACASVLAFAALDRLRGRYGLVDRGFRIVFL